MAFATKRFHIAFTYREPDDDDVIEVVSGEGGSFEVAPGPRLLGEAEEDSVAFGFAPVPRG